MANPSPLPFGVAAGVVITTGAALIATVEAFKDIGEISRSDANAGVLYPKTDKVVSGCFGTKAN